MKNLNFKNLAGVLLVFAFTCVASAQASRTWVSGVGDDANPCSRTAPCKTFAGAIAKTAAGGEIDALDPGGFGALTITKSITLDGGGGQVASVLVAGTNGIVVSAGTNDVVILRNLRINGIVGSGNGGINGIRYLAGAALYVENVDVFGFTTDCIDVSLSAAGKFVLENSTLNNCSAAGLHVGTTGGSATADLHNVHIWGTTGTSTSAGISADNGARVNVRDSVISQATIGISQPTPATLGFGSVVLIQGSTISYTTTALQANGGTFIGASGNSFFGNSTVFNTNGGSIYTGNDNPSFDNISPGSTTGTLTKL